jgi:hypothetical protein
MAKATRRLLNDRALLREVDDLQARVQAHVRGRQSAYAEAWEIADASYPNACIGMGSSRITIAFGKKTVAKVAWHGGVKMSRRQHEPKRYWRQDGRSFVVATRTPAQRIESNLRQSAFWLSLDAEQAQFACPCLVLTMGGVLWARRAEPVGPSMNPLKHRMMSFDPVIRKATQRLHRETQEANDLYGVQIMRIHRRLAQCEDRPGTGGPSGTPPANATRPNNWGWLNGRIVLTDVIGTNPNEQFDRRFTKNVKRLADRSDDISLERN